MLRRSGLRFGLLRAAARQETLPGSRVCPGLERGLGLRGKTPRAGVAPSCVHPCAVSLEATGARAERCSTYELTATSGLAWIPNKGDYAAARCFEGVIR